MSTPLSADAFIQAFFRGDEHNAFSASAIANPSHAEPKEQPLYERIRRWIEPFANGRDATVVLPRWLRNGDRRVLWYGIATTQRELRTLEEDLQAFIGPSYANVPFRPAVLDENDPVDRIVQAYSGGAAIVFEGDDRKIAEALGLMTQVQSRRQVRQHDVRRSAGIVRSEFERALSAGDFATAQDALWYLREHQLLDTLNVRFLEVEMLGRLGRWEDLLRIHDLGHLLSVRRPLAVTQMFIRGVYNVHLSAFERTGDAVGARDHFEQKVYPEFGALMSVRASMRSPEVFKTFMLRAVRTDAPDPDARGRLLGAAEDAGMADDFLRAIAALIEVEAEVEAAPADALEKAAVALFQGDADRTVSLARSAAVSLERARLLLMAAQLLQSVEAERSAAEAVTDLSKPDQAALLAVPWFASAYEEMVAGDGQAGVVPVLPAAEAVPTDWLEWFRRLRSDAFWRDRRAVDLARRGAHEWDVEAFLEREGVAHDITSEFGQAFNAGLGRVLNRALPYLLEYLERDARYPRPELQSVYDEMLTLLGLADEVGDTDLILYNNLLPAALSQPISLDRYCEIVEAGLQLWGGRGAVTRLGILVDLIEMVIVLPCYDESARLAVLAHATSEFKRHHARVEEEHRALLERYCRELNHRDWYEDIGFAAESDEKESPHDLFQRLNGMTIGIYTKTESAGRYAAQLLEDRCDNVTVHLRHDDAGNSDLKSVAQQADLFVIVWKSATHAATGFIEKYVDSSRIIHPSGKGAGSIFEAIRKHLAQLGESSARAA
jgi:hypothetical protein